jgi:large subunit ribosomal protein L4
MTQVNLYNIEAKEIGTFDLADGVFDIEPNQQVMFDAIIMQQASLRQGTHKVKTRREVSGGGKKPFAQKGTGRARQGSTRSPQMRGGGIAFGPKPRSYSYKLNKKVRRLALKSALSEKAISENLIVVDSVKMDSIKTKDFTNVMSAFGLERKTIFVVDMADDFDNAYFSLRNIPNVIMLTVEGLNTYDIVNANKMVFTKAAAEKAGEVLA